MKRWLIVALVALIGFAPAAPLVAQTQNRIVYTQVQTVTNAATTTVCTNAGSAPINCLTDPNTNQAFIVVETNPIRWYASGATPTTALGNLANAGATITVIGHANVVNFKMIATGANATVTTNVSRP